MRPLVMVLLAFAAGPQNPPKSTPGLEVRFQPAMSRHLYQAWEPYIVELENRTGRDIDAVVRLAAEDGDSIVRRKESLPAGSRKRIFLYFPHRYEQGYYIVPRVTVTDAEGRVIAGPFAPAERPGHSYSRPHQIALFTSNAESTAAFGIPRQIRSEEVALARLRASHFPDRWIGLSDLDLLLVHDAPLQDLSPRQARALAEYVRQGGTVVLAPGPDRSWLNHSVIAGFAEISLGPSETRDELPEMMAYTGRFGKKESYLHHRILNGTRLPSRSLSALVRFEYGAGEVIVFPFDIRRPPFNSWNGWEPLWTNLLTDTRTRKRQSSSGVQKRWWLDAGDGYMAAVAATMNAYPPMLLLIVLAALFLVAIGPVNYWVLRRMKMTLLNIASVPAISIVFLGIVLASGYILRGTTTLTYSARLLIAPNGGEFAEEHQLFTIFSPSTRSYRIDFGPDCYATPYQGMPSSPVTLEQGETFSLPSAALGQWQRLLLGANGVRDLGEGIHLEKTDRQVTITNETNATIVRGTYLVDTRKATYVPVGEMKPGESRTIALENPDTRPLDDLGVRADSMAGRLLSPVLVHRSGGYDRRRGLGLFCILDDGIPPIGAGLSSSDRSESITVLFVPEAKP